MLPEWFKTAAEVLGVVYMLVGIPYMLASMYHYWRIYGVAASPQRVKQRSR